MKAKLLLTVCVTVATIFSGCKKNDDTNSTSNLNGNGGGTSATANFTINGGGCQAPCEVSFTNTSTNATSYSWDFGDGNTSTAANPTHTYNSGGNYSVQLTVNSANTKTSSVAIVNAPTSCKITGVSILTCPLVDGGGVGWDAISAPDFYVYCNPGIDGSASYYSDNSSFPQSWSANWTISSSNFATTYTMQVWEHDYPDADDYVSGVNFVLSDYTTVTNHYPTQVTIGGSTTQFRLTLLWQ